MDFYITSKKVEKLEKIAKKDELYMYMYASSLERLLENKDKLFDLKHAIYEKQIDNRVFPVLFINDRQVVLSKPMYQVFFEEPKQNEITYKEDKYTSSLF